MSYLAEQMVVAGLEVDIDPAGSAIGRIGSGDLHVLLLGHIDTAEGKIPVRKEGDIIFGRGAVDAKGPLAAFVAAAALGALPHLQVTVVGAVNEEGDSAGATHLRDHFPAPDTLIIGEPSGWDRITLGYKGWVTYILTAETETSHPASGKANIPTAYELAIMRAAAAFDDDADDDTQFDEIQAEDAATDEE